MATPKETLGSLLKTKPAERQPSQPTTPSAPPAEPYTISAPIPTQPAALQAPSEFGKGPSKLPEPPDPNIINSRGPQTNIVFKDNPFGHVPKAINRIFKPTQLPYSAGGAVLDFGKSALDTLKSVDKAIIDTLSGFAELTGGVFGMPGSQAGNPVLYARNLKRLGAALGPSGLATFAATQFGLFLLNRHGKIWNPLTISPPPFVGNFVPAALDVLTGTPRLLTGYDDSNSSGFVGVGQGFYEKNHGPGGEDIHLKLAKGNYNEVRLVHYPPFLQIMRNGGAGQAFNFGSDKLIGAPSQDSSLVDNIYKYTGPLIETALETRNEYNEKKQYDENAKFSLRGLFLNSVGSDTNTNSNAAKVLEQDIIGGTGKLTKLIVSSKINADKFNDYYYSKVGKEEEFKPANLRRTNDIKLDPLYKSSFNRGIIPAGFDEDNEEGFTTEEIDDDKAYVPLCFTDLRPIVGTDKLRSVYFRPFITNLNESFSPNWNKAQYFGRTDAVASYQSTDRSVTLGFELHAFRPQDVEIIYQKLNWLASMTYPSYDKHLMYSSGPVVRLRVGDVINGGAGLNKGLPGIIEGLSFDYSDALWEIEKGSKAPRSVKVSFTFHVLHDRPIGIGNFGKFGGIGTIDEKGVYTPPNIIDTSENQNGVDISADGMNSVRAIGEIGNYTSVNTDGTLKK